MESELEIEPKIFQYMGKSEVTERIADMRNRNLPRLILNLNLIREFSEQLYKSILYFPTKAIQLFESQLKALTSDSSYRSQKKKTVEKSILSKKIERNYKITFDGMFGKNMVSPRGLTAQLSNQLVCVQGILTRMSIVRPKLIHSAHYCEETKNGFIKDYFDQYSLASQSHMPSSNETVAYFDNSIPLKDIHNNPLSFEYNFFNV